MGAAGLRRATRRRTQNVSMWITYAQLAFSMSLAVLCIGGARELLRPSWTLVPAVLGALLGLAGAFLLSVPRASSLPLVAVGWLSLLHAADAACRRSAADARGRLLALVLVLIGGVGWTWGLWAVSVRSPDTYARPEKSAVPGNEAPQSRLTPSPERP